MRRRQLLATSASTALAASAGCFGAWPDSTDLGVPEEELNDDGREKHLVYTRDSERQAVVTIQQRSRQPSLDERLPLRLHVWHREGLRTERMAFRLRAPPTVGNVPADVYLRVPHGGPWPEFDLRRDDDLWTVIAVDDLGDLGSGSLRLDLIVDPTTGPVEEVTIRADVVFEGTGLLERDYRATANTRFEVISS